MELNGSPRPKALLHNGEHRFWLLCQSLSASPLAPSSLVDLDLFNAFEDCIGVDYCPLPSHYGLEYIIRTARTTGYVRELTNR